LQPKLELGTLILNLIFTLEVILRRVFNILEICRATKSNLIFVSSSSVYGNSTTKYFQESNETSKPISFYAATKKSNEIMAYAYVKNYNFLLL